MAEEMVDVLVIGSGPAGASLTKRLTDLGAQVLCLEAGDWVRPSDYPNTHENWEAINRRGGTFRERAIPTTFEGQMRNVNCPAAVGGALVNGMHYARFRPSDFRIRTLDGVADDWPISYQDLVPYYDMNDIASGTSGASGDPANPPRMPRPLPPLPIGIVGETMGRGFDKLGWYWWPCDTAIPSRDYDGRPACMQHGHCHDGCFHGVKATADVLWWPRALKKGARLRTKSRAFEVTVDAQGRATGARYFDEYGAIHEQPARVVVVSCNGVGTPRLLLNSKSKLFPQGLGNANGQVGKNFMSHVWGSFSGIYDYEIDATTAVPLVVTSQHFYETDSSRGFVRGYAFLVHDRPGPLGHAMMVPWGAGHHKRMKKVFPHHINMTTLGDDLPEEENRIELDPVLKDPFGIPAPKVFYRYGANSLAMQKHAAEMGKQAMEASGAVEVRYNDSFPSGSHLLGTARMGNDPKRSVVNAWNQVHDVKNLFCVDGSSFTTGGPVNPTHTIIALALRCADGIWERRREWT